MALFSRIAPVIALTLFAFSCAGKRNNKKNAPPPVGWHTEEGWIHSCYFPPNFEELAGMARKDASMSGVDEILAQWRGNRGDGISFDANVIDDVEIIILATVAKGERVLPQNLEFCMKSALGQGTADWNAWVRGLPAKLTEGECHQHLDYTVFQWLEIGVDWQEERPVCPGDVIRITGSAGDRFRVSQGGPWINVEGDPERPTVGMDDYPCARDGCLEGMLIMRYQTESGMDMIFPVGTEFIYEIPEKGTISYQINDVTFYDNTWFQSGGLIDKTAIEISPIK
jgi:hypothetical protein